MNATTETIPTIDQGTLKVTRHTGPGHHRATKKLRVNDKLRTVTENRRRTRTAKATKVGRYRAETQKTNLTWFIGFIFFVAVTFAATYGLLIGMMTADPVVTLQTRTETIHETTESFVVSPTCIQALNLADKGFNVAMSKPLVKILDKGKSSNSVKITPKFAKEMQIELYKISGKYDFVRDQCLTDIPDTKTTSVRTTSNIQ
jgi:hypothetical protein